MWFIELGAICVTVAVVVRVWWLVVQVLRARNKRRLLSRMFGVVSDSPDFIGISAICHDIDSVSQVADLLDVEYASYELLVVMDARLKPELFHEMLRHYRMMRVDYHPFEACSQLGVRGFYRSQTRGVNRLTLLDQMEAFSAVSSDAAVRAASYDYILPIGRNLRLKRGAIDRLAMELAVHPIHSISFVRTAVGPSLRLYAREYVGRLGRFDRADGYELSRKERITLYEPLFYELRPSRYVWILTLTGMALLAGCAIAAWSFGWLPMTLLLLDILLLWGLFLWLGAVSAPFPAGKRNAALGAVLTAAGFLLPEILRIRELYSTFILSYRSKISLCLTTSSNHTFCPTFSMRRCGPVRPLCRFTKTRRITTSALRATRLRLPSRTAGRTKRSRPIWDLPVFRF